MLITNTLDCPLVPSSFMFQPVAVETLFHFIQSALGFTEEVGNHVSLFSNNRRTISFPFFLSASSALILWYLYDHRRRGPADNSDIELLPVLIFKSMGH